MTCYYVYVLKDPRKSGAKYGMDFLPKYIGKGSGARAVYSAKSRTSDIKESWVLELEDLGMKPLVKILKKNLTESQAMKLEKKLISALGRSIYKQGPLLNIRSGGAGTSHTYIPEKEYRLALRSCPSKVRLVDEYTRSTLQHRHSCRIHGVFNATPKATLARLTKGGTACTRCNKILGGEKLSQTKSTAYASNFKALLKSHKKYALLGPCTEANSKIKIVCPTHGKVAAWAKTATSSMKKGRPPCPKCGMEQRGDSSAARRAGLEKKYVAILDNTGPDFKRKGKFVANNVKLKFWCRVHGDIMLRPSYVVSKIKNGQPPCMSCVFDIRNAKNRINSKLGAKARASKSTLS